MSALTLLGCSAESNEPESETFESLSAPLSSGHGLDATLLPHSVWNEGFCGEVVLKNSASSTVNNWSIGLDFGGTTLDSGWSAKFSQRTGVATVTPEDWTRQIAPGQETRFGFCATKSGAAPLPKIVSVTDDLPGGGCVTVAQPSGRIMARVSNVDDNVYLMVNGLRAKTWNYGGSEQGELVDVTRFFSAGQNEVSFLAMNTGGPANYSVELLVDGVSVLNRSCSGECAATGDSPVGILLSETLDLSLANLPTPQLVTLTSDVPGPVYVDGQYTGQTTPTTLLLPVGSFSIGLGRSTNAPGAYTGQYFERQVAVGSCALSVDLDENGPLPVQNRTRIALLPIRTTDHGTAGDVGVLTNEDITNFAAQAQATTDAWVKPFSYGLTEWNLTLLPTVENVALHRDADAGAAPQTDRFLTEAGLQGLRSQFDTIVFYYSTHKADNSNVTNGPCCIWAGGQDISYDTGWVRGGVFGRPSEGLYHESMHSYEWYNGWKQRAYNGVDGLHGAEEHGYVWNQNNEGDWLAWYRDFARGLAVETADMRAGVQYPFIPASGDLYVGIFDTMRYGTQSARPSAGGTQPLQALSRDATVHGYSK
jgi:hypothetical protein